MNPLLLRVRAALAAWDQALPAFAPALPWQRWSWQTRRRVRWLAWLLVGGLALTLLSGMLMLAWLVSPLATMWLVGLCGIGVFGFPLGHLWITGGHGPRHFGKLLHHTVERAQAGEVAAMVELSEIYRGGTVQGLRPNPSEALWWASQAAKAGSPQAAYTLATLLEAGQGTAKDPAGAQGWYRVAAEAGYGPAVHRLARLAAAADADADAAEVNH